MILLALTSRLIANKHGDLAPSLAKGDPLSALRQCKQSLDRPFTQDESPRRADQGRLLGRIMLACGREEETEELFQRQLKLYGATSREAVRWNAALDQGALLQHMNKLSRAIECFFSVADDRRAPVDMRIEAMASAAVALHRTGDCRAAQRALEIGRTLAESMNDTVVAQMIDCLALEQSIIQRERASDALADHALCDLYCDGLTALQPREELRLRLIRFSTLLNETAPIAAQRMKQLLHLIECDASQPATVARVLQDLTWLKERHLAGLETHARTETALILMARGAFTSASELIRSLSYQEHQLQHHRYALDLQYCVAKIRHHQNRHCEALRLYWRHAQHAVRSIKADGANKKRPSFLDVPNTAQDGEAAKLRLPLRYRHAYQYIMDHLQDERLSVYQVAAHINVTERALQMAFRTHLGQTPAELIRTRRMDRIHDELQEQGKDERVLEVASRWGITNRSTLAHNYRARFDQTPTQTRQGETR